jgi:hypothetical protein
MLAMISLLPRKHHHQQSVVNAWTCILDNPMALQCAYSISNVLVAFKGNNACDDIATTTYKSASTHRQQFFVLHHEISKGCTMEFTHG